MHQKYAIIKWIIYPYFSILDSRFSILDSWFLILDSLSILDSRFLILDSSTPTDSRFSIPILDSLHRLVGFRAHFLQYRLAQPFLPVYDI